MGTGVEASKYEALRNLGLLTQGQREPGSDTRGAVRLQAARGQGTDVATDLHCWDQGEYPPSVLDHDVVKNI